MFPSDKNPHKILLEVGTLELVEAPVQTPSYIFTGYFWRDAGSPQGYGPFESVYEAMTHYTSIVRQFKKDPAIDIDRTSNLIKVDFVNKRKI